MEVRLSLHEFNEFVYRSEVSGLELARLQISTHLDAMDMADNVIMSRQHGDKLKFGCDDDLLASCFGCLSQASSNRARCQTQDALCHSAAVSEGQH